MGGPLIYQVQGDIGLHNNPKIIMTHQEVQGKKSLPKLIKPPPEEQNSWTLTVITQKNEATLHTKNSPFVTTQGALPVGFFFLFCSQCVASKKTLGYTTICWCPNCTVP